MSLIGAVDVLDDAERALHPGSLAIAAYFDGRVQAEGGTPRVFPRRLTRDEEESWRDGWNEARAELLAELVPTAPVLHLVPAACRRCPLIDVREAA